MHSKSWGLSGYCYDARGQLSDSRTARAFLRAFLRLPLRNTHEPAEIATCQSRRQRPMVFRQRSKARLQLIKEAKASSYLFLRSLGRLDCLRSIENMGCARKMDTVTPALVLLGYCLLSSCLVAAQTNSTDCNAEVTKLIPCLSFVQGSDSTPSSNCCTPLREVLAKNRSCICELAKTASAGSSGINITNALALPGKCNIQGIDASTCNIALPPGVAVAPTAGGGPAEAGGEAGGATPGSPNSAAHGLWSVPSMAIAAAIAASFLFSV